MSIMQRFREWTMGKNRTDSGILILAVGMGILASTIIASLLAYQLLLIKSDRRLGDALKAQDAAVSARDRGLFLLNQNRTNDPYPSEIVSGTMQDGLTTYTVGYFFMDYNTAVIWSRGTNGNASRYLESVATLVTSTADASSSQNTPPPTNPWQIGLFANKTATLGNGGNPPAAQTTVYGYSSGGSYAENTSTGVVGTNYRINDWNPSYWDSRFAQFGQVRLYNDPNSNCSGAIMCSAGFRTPTRTAAKFDISNTTFIERRYADCEAALSSGTAPEYVASIDGPIPAGTSCYSKMTFDTTVGTAGNANAEVFVQGTVTFRNNAIVNMPAGFTGTAGQASPQAPRLKIFGYGTTVSFSSGSQIAAGLYFPRATCGTNPSNGNPKIWGALLCNSLGGTGAWQIRHDSVLASQTNTAANFGNTVSASTRAMRVQRTTTLVCPSYPIGFVCP
jgi:hypothetical protein